MALVMTVTQQVDLTIQPVDAHGNPAAVDGVPVWTSSEPDKVEVTSDLTGMFALARAVGPITTSPVQVNVTADADLGSGVRSLVGVLEISIVAGEAVSLGIVADPPVEQNPAA